MKRNQNVDKIPDRKIRSALRNPESLTAAMRQLGLSPTNSADRRNLLARIDLMGLEVKFRRKRPTLVERGSKACLACGASFVGRSERKYCSHICYVESKRLPKEERLTRRRRKRDRMRANGICTSCGAVADVHRVTCKKCRDRQLRHRKNNPEKIKLAQRARNQKIKAQAIYHYGRSCECCGEANLHFLTLDHTNDDGRGHRKEMLAEGSGSLYQWLLKQKFEHSYSLRVLCYNCNLGRRITKVCPHQLDVEQSA